MPSGSPQVVAALDDLLFLVKIQDAARRAGIGVAFVNSLDALLGAARQRPALILLDLNTNALPALAAATRLKSDPEFEGVPVVGYVSHVQTELRQKAEEAGLDLVLARSAFSANLPDLLRQYVTPPA